MSFARLLFLCIIFGLHFPIYILIKEPYNAKKKKERNLKAARMLPSFFLSWTDSTLFTAALLLLYVSAAINVVSLPFNPAPYGKHSPAGVGSTAPAAVAWFLMESPTLWLSLLLYPLGRHRLNPLSLLLLSLYLLHYSHRTLVYPLRLRNRSQRVPVTVVVAAFVFNLLNAYVQIRSISHYRGGDWSWARVLVGAAIFVWGMAVNIRSDLALVQLKKEGGGGYRIPRGGWFEWVCSPNYMGEAAEWLGWALVAGLTPAAAGFFLYTCSNLVPRARANLRWYRDKFGSEFPSERKAIVPLLY